MSSLGIIICQSCGKTIEHFEEEKVTTLYAHCNNCPCDSVNKENRKLN
ncbi:GapA-binding peptide SR1P [Bacillus sp. DJP31]